MGVYCYKISRKGRKVKYAPTFDGRIYEAEFAYKTGGWDYQHLHNKYVAPTVRAWKKNLFKVYFDENTVKRILFVMDWMDGAEVYRRNSVSWMDSRPTGEVVGYLRMDGETGKFRFEPTAEFRDEVKLSRRHLGV
jgi:hypothetical protein